MPITNGTKEKVGVEVSGPTRASGTTTAVIWLGAGIVVTSAGLLIPSPTLIIMGAVVTIVSVAMLLEMIRKGVPGRKVLEKGGMFAGFDPFTNQIVKFFHVDEREDFREPAIAEVDFVTGKITCPPRPPETVALTSLTAMDALRVTLRPPAKEGYQIELAPVTGAA